MRVRRVWCWHFTGLARRTGLSIRETYAYFARHRINVVFLADNSQVMYLNGVDSLGGTFEQTLEKLRTLIGEWGITDLLTFGNSAGGYGAMLYGAHLGARRILSIAGPSRLDPEFEPRVVSFSRVEVLQEVRKTRSLDLAHVLPPLAPLPRIDCYYALDCAEDVAQAQNIAHLRSVVLHPIPSGGHAVMLAMDKTGDLRKAVNELFSSGH